jgi:AraC-like DNA-binding protein
MSSQYFVRPTIPARYLVELLAQSGVNARRCLTGVGLPPELDALPRFRASVEQFERLYRVALKACGDELFGFCRRAAPAGTYASAMRLATGSRDLAEFFESMARFYAIFDDGRRPFAIATTATTATLRLDPRTPAQRSSIFYVHAMLLSAWRSACWLVGEPIALGAVRLEPRFRRFARETAFLFGREPELVSGACELEFEASWLRAAIRVTASDTDRYARGSLRTMLDAPASDVLEVRIRQILATDRPFASSDLVAIAARLHCSRATLARRLTARGLTFQSIKDALRRDHAIALLVGGRLSVATVAERLGFSEPSAFTRAFKAWTKVAPARYRALAARGGR